MSQCKYCKSSSYGSGCPYAPNKVHEHNEDEKKCIYCGSLSYGSGCPYSPEGRHKHASGGNKCIWCGSTSTGSGCVYNPSRDHEKQILERAHQPGTFSPFLFNNRSISNPAKASRFQILCHGNPRVVYGIALARSFSETLLGLDKEPSYFIPFGNAKDRTNRIAEY